MEMLTLSPRGIARASATRKSIAGSAFALTALAVTAGPAFADEGGVSFWLPGLFGSLAAVPQEPGFSIATFYYHTTVSAGPSVALARDITIGQIPVNATATVSASLHSTADLGTVVPTYTFATPVLGGQLAVGVMTIVGGVDTSLAGSVSGTLATEFGSLPFMRSANISDSVVGFGDL
jgi:hypothetical protein